ncbi:kinase D interacting substrate of 220 kDa [Echinococcus multilocularis]|uniref:Kinase D interacting substrate of 220 kDa n=1 Tax=Echinococcus multilocularis TaxID=6211 RepID=A0A068XU95_ECHMU|nr:kinase D interacting substrate of 220 kDa [Echinococcus multilocularis]
MQVSGSTRQEKDWSAFIPNGGFGVKRPPRLIGLGPSPTAVNFLQEELGHNPTLETINSSFSNRNPQPPEFSTHGDKGPPHAEPRSDFEMRELMSLTGSPMVEAGDFGCSPTKDSQEGRAIRALADLFMCPATTFPLSVGLFYDTVSTTNASNHQSSSLKQLEEDIQILLRLNTKALPTFSAALVLVPAMTIFFAAYMLAVTVNFKVGLSLGILGLFTQLFVLLAIAIGKQCFNLRIAWSASLILSSFVRQVNLFTKFFFCYPRRKFNSMSPVKLQIVKYDLPQSPNTPHLILMLLKLMWLAMERQYNPVVVRLQRFMHQSTYPLSTKRAYKRICCLPAYVVVTLVGVAILIDLLLLRLFDFNTIAMLTDMRVLPVFVIMSSVIFLGVCASVPSLANAAFAYFYRPKTPLVKAIESYATGSSEPWGKHKKRTPLLDSLIARVGSGSSSVKLKESFLQSSLEAADVLPVTSSCEVDILAKKEFANICDMLHAFNFYLQNIEQTRLVVMIDATEATSAVQLAGAFYQVHSLLLTQPNAPIAFVIATNVTAFYEKSSSMPHPDDTVFQGSQSGELSEALNLLRGIADCNHLVLFSVQLPIFLDAATIKTNPSILQRLCGAKNLCTLFQNFADTTPISPHLSTVVPEGARNGEHPQIARSKNSIGSNTGQINQAYTSAEELGHASGEAISEPSTVIKSAQSTTSLSAQNQLQQQHLLLKQQSGSSGSTSPALVKNVNTSRMTSTRAGAKGIAAIFLANEELAELNVPIIRTLVAETAFASRLIRHSSTSVSIKQLVNWICLTQHWPFHMSWTMVLLEAEHQDGPTTEGAIQTAVSSPNRGQKNALLGLIKKTLEEVSSLPPIGSILSGDDRDPGKLLHFIRDQVDCHYSLVDLKHLAVNSLFLSPVFRVCVKGEFIVISLMQQTYLHIPQQIRHFYFGAVGGDGQEVEMEHNPPASIPVAPTVKPHEIGRSFYVTAPMPQSFDTLPQCLEFDYNRRSRSGGGGRGGEGGTQNDSSGDTHSPLPVSVDSEPPEKGLCYSNPFNLPIVSPCPIRLKCSIPVMGLSEMNVDDVCMLLSAISDLPPSNCSSYQMQVRRQNINGQVLSVCDLAKLRTELHMSFGDWQLFNTFITYLRGVEASLADRSRNSQTASFAGDVKSSHGSLAVSPPYPYSQVLVPPPFVFCNEQSQTRGKNLFDVPVLVQQVPVESNVASARQNTDRTTSDFSFGSGTDELELAWRRNAKPDSLNGNSKYQYTSKESTSRQYAGQGNAIWMEPIDRLSKSTHDLRSINTSRPPQRRQIASRGGERRHERNTRKTEKQVPTSLFQSASSASDHLVQMVPAYISRAPDSSGVIPVWYPTLPRVGEANKLQQSIKMNEGYSSESSSASMDGTYDFPSEYSSGDRYSQRRHVYLRQCPANCPHSHRERRRRRKSSRSSRSINRTVQRISSRKSSMGRCSQKSAEGCTCDYFLYEEGQSARSSTAVNPWTAHSPRKISSPDLSDIEAMTSS